MTSEDVGDGLEGLRRDLRVRRLASLNTNHPVHQTEVAEAMNVSAAYVSRLENGRRSIRRLSGREVWEFLRGYGLTPGEIRRAVEAYNLNVPPQLVGDGGTAQGMVTVLYEGSVSKRTPPEPRMLHDQTEGRFPPDELRIRSVEPHDLLTPNARRMVPVGSRLWLHTGMGPDQGMTAIVRQDGVEVLCVWPILEPTFALPGAASSGVEPVRLDPDRVEFVQRVVSIAIPQV